MTDTRPRRPAPYNPARELAVRVLLRVLHADTFAAPALDAALHSARLPARDSGLATHIVYGTLRHHLSLSAALSPLLSEDTHPKVRTLLLAGAFEKLYLGTPPHAVVSEYVNLARGARLAPPGLINAVLRRIALPEGNAASELPDWLRQVYLEAYGEQAPAVMADLLEPQPLWLSVSEAGAAALEAEGSRLNGELQGLNGWNWPGHCASPAPTARVRPSPSTPPAWPAWMRWAMSRVCGCWTWPAGQV
ncbi:transcription antitermination factor NusB [Deinococcus malanensis]|uniref:transcription antitermination factor NusB n=1 Tax=Deinococcus malanensis TaxID=1706855 RepID=UPI00362A14AE